MVMIMMMMMNRHFICLTYYYHFQVLNLGKTYNCSVNYLTPYNYIYNNDCLYHYATVYLVVLPCYLNIALCIQYNRIDYL